jgi:branched-subunit amino acid transport protein
VSLWLIIILGGLITFAIRLSFILFWGRLNVPDWLQCALRFVPPAVLTAIIFPELLIREGSLDVSMTNPRLVAGAIAILVGLKTKNMILTILVGMAALWLLQIWLT